MEVIIRKKTNKVIEPLNVFIYRKCKWFFDILILLLFRFIIKIIIRDNNLLEFVFVLIEKYKSFHDIEYFIIISFNFKKS
jgi:hypothetical protein